MMTMTLRRLALAAPLLAAGIVFAVLVGSRTGSAAPVEATWALAGRAGTDSFVAGTSLPDGDREGFPIISTAAVGPTAGLATYRYDPAAPPFITCDAVLSESNASITLDVANGYPYAGCVFFLAAINTGDTAMRVNLGTLEDPGGVFCSGATCRVEMVAGGPDAATAAELCVSTGGVAETAATDDGLTYELQPGASLTCPLFIVVLQPAAEGTRYTITVRAPVPTPGDTGGGAQPPPPPPTGTGIVVRSGDRDGNLLMLSGAFVAALGLVLFAILPGRRRRRAERA